MPNKNMPALTSIAWTKTKLSKMAVKSPNWIQPFHREKAIPFSKYRDRI
jgi:hypothetical protein